MLEQKEKALSELLLSYKQVAVAYSGGVDSTFLLAMAIQTLGRSSVRAYTVKTPFISLAELADSRETAQNLKADQRIIELPLPLDIQNNPVDRCYICKKNIFTKLLDTVKKDGFSVLCDGTNADDLTDDRPGLVALHELKIHSPLAEAQLTKKDIRLLAEKSGLRNFNKPAYPCLLTRLPFDTPVTEEAIRRIEAAENFLHSLGFDDVRVRCHDTIARIVINPQRRKELFDMDTEITAFFQSIGFLFVTVDLLGYRKKTL